MHRRLPPSLGSVTRFVSRLAVVASAATVGSLAAPGPLPAQEPAGEEARAARAAEIVDTAREKRFERWEGVENYTVYGIFKGADVAHHYEKTTVDGLPAFRLVPPHEDEGDELDEAGLSNGIPAFEDTGDAPGGPEDALPTGGLPELDDLPVPEGVRGAADRLDRARDAVTDNPLGGAAEDVASGGLQRQLMQRGMQGMMGGMQDDGTAEAAADARTEAMMFDALAREGRFAGTETIDGREALVLVADDLTDVDLAAATGGETDVRVRSVKIWLDAEEYVPLRSEMEMISGSEAPPMTIEIHNRDYRRVETLYESFDRTISTAGTAGMLGGDSGVGEKMQQGMEDMERMKERMDEMPPAQRRMFEQQMERMEGMAGDGGMGGTTIEMSTEEIVVNEGPPTKHGRGTIVVSGGAAAEVSRTIATVGSGSHPEGGGALSTLQLIGGIEGEANEATAMLQLNVPRELPERGTVSGQGALSIQWGDGRRGTFQSGEAEITVTSRTSRHVRGEYNMEAEGYVADDGVDGPEPSTVTLQGTFDAVLPMAARQAPAGSRPTPMMPGGAGMQP
ncbi:MAG: hypothetical protein ACODAA_07035 [Gemmatimonadota bacterium]